MRRPPTCRSVADPGALARSRAGDRPTLAAFLGTALALALSASALTHAQPESPAPASKREIPPPIPADQIEIMAGSERIRVPSSVASRATDPLRESGVLPIRGAKIGVPESPFEIRRTTLSAPRRGELRAQLRALLEIYRETFEVPLDAELAADLEILNALEERGPGAAPLVRRAHEHDLDPPPPSFRRARERALMARALHATSHAIVRRYWPEAPFWLDEGLAVLFEGISIDSEAVRVGLSEEQRARHAATLRRMARGAPDQVEAEALRKLTEPSQLLSLDRARWEALPAERARRVQTEFGALVLYFLEDLDFVFAISDRLFGGSMLEKIEIASDEAEAYTRAWRRSRDAEVRVTLLDLRPEPPPEVVVVRPIRRDFRCVPATVSTGPAAFRVVLFCTRGNRLLERGGVRLLQ